MTKIEFIISLIVMIFSFCVAVKIMSDRISERMNNSRNMRTLLTVISLILSVFSSLGVAIFAEYDYAEFYFLRFSLNVFSGFGIYLGLSIIIGVLKRKIDENRKRKNFYKSLDIEKMLEETRKARLSKKIINFEKKKREKQKESKTSN